MYNSHENELIDNNRNLHASNDAAKTANNGEKGVKTFTAEGNVLCIYEPSRTGATTTYMRSNNHRSKQKSEHFGKYYISDGKV